MSRLARRPIPIPQGVAVEIRESNVFIQGPKGERTLGILPHVQVLTHSDGIGVTSLGKDAQSRANCGTMWSLIHNAVRGVAEGFKKTLEIQGVGYRAALEGNNVVLHLGYAHPVRFVPPPQVAIAVEKNAITVSGTDKELVGRVAAEIRSLKPPEPYKGKGIRYAGEIIRIKAGKKAATTAAG